MCLCLLFACFTYTLLSKFCLISAVVVRCCDWPNDSFSVCFDALAVFSRCMGDIANINACLLHFVCAFGVFADCFSCRFCVLLFACFVAVCLCRPRECIFDSFAALVYFPV